MVRADMDDALAHDLIKLMFDHKKELAEVHPWAEKLELEDAQKIVEPVELHEGAQRYYEEARRMRPLRRCSRSSLLAGCGGGPASSRATARAAWSRGRAAGGRALRAHLPPLRLPGARRGALQGHAGGFVLDSVASPSRR